MANMNKRTVSWICASLVIVILAFGGYYWWHLKQTGKPEKMTGVRFSTVPFIGSAPLFVAKKNGYFKEQGLDVTFTFNPGGWMSLKDLFEGKADIATVAELPIVYSAFDKKKYTDFERGDFCIIGDVIYSQAIQQVVARKDRGINSPSDFKGKRVGVFKGTTLDFFMDAFFTDHRIKYSDVEIVDMDVFKLTDAIGKGDLDLIFTWQPHVARAQKILGDNAVTFQSRGKYTTCWLIVVMKEYAEKNPEVLEGFLMAIAKAEKFIRKHPEQAKDIHAEIGKTDREIVATLWDAVDFDLSLGRATITTMEDEAKWLIRKGMYKGASLPDFLDYICIDPLQKVKPGSIQIIR